MAKLQVYAPKVTVTAVLTLDHEEIAALEALTCYGIDAFIRVFYKQLGETSMRPHEDGLRRFLGALSGPASAGMSAVHAAERTLERVRVEKGKPVSGTARYDAS